MRMRRSLGLCALISIETRRTWPPLDGAEYAAKRGRVIAQRGTCKRETRPRGCTQRSNRESA